MSETASNDDKTRRDFLLLSTIAVGAVGSGLAVWPFVDSMNPAADTLALSTTEVDLEPIEEGQSITVVWQGKPEFVRHRKDRGKKSGWLIMVGICPHLGCIPLGQKASDPKGEFGGWFCPCHGSHYDTSGRIRKGPAPKNLPVPAYQYLTDTTVKIG